MERDHRLILNLSAHFVVARKTNRLPQNNSCMLEGKSGDHLAHLLFVGNFIGNFGFATRLAFGRRMSTFQGRRHAWYVVSGVRPSSAAATSARSSGSDCPNLTGSPCVSAPETGALR